MPRSSHPDLPPSSEAHWRRLNRNAGGDRPLRTQLVITAVLALVLLAVPLYLLRRPNANSAAFSADAGVQTFGGVFRSEPDASTGSSQVQLGPVQRVRCGISPSQITGEGELCDALPALETALRQTILSSLECAPRTGKEGSLNYVLEVDFANHRYSLFPGKSGKWHGPQARRATQCVLRAFPPVDLSEIHHQYNYYAIAILAEYPAPDPLEILPTFD